MPSKPAVARYCKLDKYNEDLIMIFNWNWKFSLLSLSPCVARAVAVHLSSYWEFFGLVTTTTTWERRRCPIPTLLLLLSSQSSHNETKTIVLRDSRLTMEKSERSKRQTQQQQSDNEAIFAVWKAELSLRAVGLPLLWDMNRTRGKTMKRNFH